MNPNNLTAIALIVGTIILMLALSSGIVQRPQQTQALQWKE